ncbi:MAG: sensor histidine kinase [Treponema sp.]|jgi:two-component system sensor histidine kinase YesM|nr:sensor histidine kinase [Treponema sp.]
MAAWYSPLLGRAGAFFINPSVKRTIKTSHIVIISLMLIPLFVSLVISLFNTVSYDRLISNVSKTNRLNQIVKTDISNELWDIVAGNKSFGEGRQYEIIGAVNASINDIMSTTAAENRQLLEVAGRAMNTLTRYVDRLGSQMEASFPVVENERILDEIRGVSLLVSEILQDFIVLEIESAAAANEEIKRRTFIIGGIELGIMVFVTIFSVLVQISVASNVDRSIGALVSLSSRIAEGDLGAQAKVPQITEFHTLTENLNAMAGKIKALLEDNIREQQNRQMSEMKALQAQISPHFLYNTLDSTIWLAEGNQYEEVVSITRALSNFFRISLNRGSEWLHVHDEFKHVESYLTIQKIRYRDILDYSIEYEQEMGDRMILKLLLQPLVENALYHGIKNKRSRGTIRVRGWREEPWLRFSIEDNGIGMTGEQLENIKKQLADPAPDGLNAIYGLYNVNKRLELYYNRTDLLEIESVYREGTRVSLKVPEAYQGV